MKEHARTQREGERERRRARDSIALESTDKNILKMTRKYDSKQYFEVC